MTPISILYLGGASMVLALREAGHAVLHVGPQSDADIVQVHPITLAKLLHKVSEKGFVPQAMVYEDNGNLPQFLELESCAVPSIFYSIDTYCNPWHIPFANAFDHVFVAQKPYVDVFSDNRDVQASWLPLYSSHVLPVQGGTAWFNRDIPVSFVGTLNPKNIPERKPFLDAFKREHVLFCKQGAFVPVFERSRIVLNQTAVSELNFRCFEAMACGAALLMEACPGIEDVFTPGETILPLYRRGDAIQAAAIAKEWLEKPQELAKIAMAGYNLVCDKHTAKTRAVVIEEKLLWLHEAGCVQKRLANAGYRRQLISTVYAILAIELDKPELAAHKELYKMLFLQKDVQNT